MLRVELRIQHVRLENSRELRGQLVVEVVRVVVLEGSDDFAVSDGPDEDQLLEFSADVVLEQELVADRLHRRDADSAREEDVVLVARVVKIELGLSVGPLDVDLRGKSGNRGKYDEQRIMWRAR